MIFCLFLSPLTLFWLYEDYISTTSKESKREYIPKKYKVDIVCLKILYNHSTVYSKSDI